MLRWKIIILTIFCALLIGADEIDDLEDEINLEDLGEPFLDETIIGSVKQGSVVTSRELDAVIRTTQRRVNNVVRITRALNREVDLVNKSADEVLELAKQVAVVSTPKTTP